jgi:hypothetical protein
MRYWQAGREKSLPLGVYPKVSLSDAGKKRDELGKQLQADLDLFLASLPFNQGP